MAISFVGAASAQTSAETTPTTTSIASVLPSGIASGDLILIAVHRSQNYAITATPTGYTALDNVIDNGTAPAAADTDIYYRIADGSETTTGPTFSTATATRFIAQAAVYRGVNTTTPFVAHAGQDTTGAGTASRAAPAITTGNANVWGVFTTGVRVTVSPVSFTPPTGMTEQLDNDCGLTTGTTNLSAEWADTAGPVGSTGSFTYTATSSGTSTTAIAWAAFLAPVATAPTQTSSVLAAGVGGAQIGGSALGFGVGPFGTAPFGGPGVRGLVNHPVTATAAGVGAATVAAAAATWSGTPAAAGTGTATVSGFGTQLDGLTPAAGAGAAAVTGTLGLATPPHIPTLATLTFNGISSAMVLPVAPGVSVLASDGTGAARLVSDGISSAVLAVAPFDATIQTT